MNLSDTQAQTLAAITDGKLRSRPEISHMTGGRSNPGKSTLRALLRAGLITENTVMEPTLYQITEEGRSALEAHNTTEGRTR